MRVIIRDEHHKFYIPVPLCLGGIGIRCALKYGTETPVTKEKRDEILLCYKVFKKAIKPYKGLKIVEVEDAQGKGVTIIV